MARGNGKYDYGHGDPSKLRSYRINAYDLSNPSEDRADVRQTSGYADNAMDNPSVVKEGEDESSLDTLHGMLKKIGVTDEELQGGFNLTQRGYHKVAAAMGTSVEHVQSLVTSLVKKLSGAPADNKVLAERGRVDAYHQPSIMDEITSDIGSMEFPWKLGNDVGTATAAYKSEGKKFYLKVAQVRDQEGNIVVLSPEQKKQIRAQAIDFIGKE